MQTADPRALARMRGIYANRTLNLRSIRAIGYDMDYTLIHYNVEAWERRAYEHMRRRLAGLGWPVDKLVFDPELAIRGLVIDIELGNVVKANRFGYVKRAHHGTRILDYEEQRRIYSRVIVDLAERRWEFLNTLFSLSEACMYMQLVDLVDRRELPGVLNYADLYVAVRESIDAAHMEGKLKEEIAADPDAFALLDPEVPLTLLDQKYAGKRLMLITNSEWPYTASMMRYAFERFLPTGTPWQELFDLVIVGAGKPGFFQGSREVFEVATPDGLLRPWYGPLQERRAYYGGYAGLVEKSLGMSGDEILYIGDHIYGDVHVSKSLLRWRTGLILRELEEEIAAEEQGRHGGVELAKLMLAKEELEREFCQVRLMAQRARGKYAPSEETPRRSVAAARMAELRKQIAALDASIAPLAHAASQVSNQNWGLMMRAGNDKSHLARQVERSADVYTSRVSNFMLATPFAFLRAPRGSLPHDPLSTAPPASEAEAKSGRV